MEINQIVEDQITHTFNNTDIKENEVIGVQINETTRISLQDDNSITLRFLRPKELELGYIVTFFSGRIPSDNASVYIRKHSISIYTRYTTKAEGIEKLKRAMDIFKNFENLHSQFLTFSNLITTD